MKNYKHITTLLLIIYLLIYSISNYFLTNSTISGYNDDGYYWSLVFSDSCTELSCFSPNILVLKAFSTLGLSHNVLHIFNALAQTIGFILFIDNIREISKKEFNFRIPEWVMVLWVVSVFEFQFIQWYLMRDVWILLLITEIIKRNNRGLFKNVFLYVLLFLIRPAASIVPILFYAFMKLKKIKTVVVILILSIFLSYKAINNYFGYLISPAAYISGQEFDLEDAIGTRHQYLGIDGYSSEDMIILPFLNFSRPVIFHDPYRYHRRKNGLTGEEILLTEIEVDVVFQNFAVISNVFINLMVIISIISAVFSGDPPRKRMIAFFIFFLLLISFSSGQGRHMLMFIWLEPIIIAYLFQNKKKLC